MPYHVSRLRNMRGDPYRYLFFLVAWNEYPDPVREEFARQGEAFAKDLGGSGAFISPLPDYVYDVAAEVASKNWPDELELKFKEDGEPILLITGGYDYEDFEPRQHEFAIIWLSDFGGDPQTIKPLLMRLARLVRNDEDVIAYLREVADREQRHQQAQKAAQRGVRLARVASYVQVKPTLFGVSIDLNALLRDLAVSRAAD